MEKHALFYRQYQSAGGKRRGRVSIVYQMTQSMMIGSTESCCCNVMCSWNLGYAFLGTYSIQEQYGCSITKTINCRCDLANLFKMPHDQRFMKWLLGFCKLQSYQSMCCISYWSYTSLTKCNQELWCRTCNCIWMLMSASITESWGKSVYQLLRSLLQSYFEGNHTNNEW